jgi:CDP-diacylglycerol--serine O-phosphatidyltransferase
VLRHFLNPPNWFTAASIFCSTSAMALLLGASASPHGGVSPELIARACVLVVFGGIFDNLDGRVARLIRRQSDFGVQLDSIADILGFGLAPALIAWTWKLHELGRLGIAFTFFYVVCAAFRLARFNVNTTTSAWPFAGHSQGLTSTMSGGILVTLIWLANGYLADAPLVAALSRHPAWIGGFLVLLGWLMVSAIPFRNFKDAKSNANARRYLAVSMSLALGAGLWMQEMAMIFGVGSFLYLVVGLIDGLAVASLNGALTPGLLLGEDPCGAAEEDEEDPQDA